MKRKKQRSQKKTKLLPSPLIVLLFQLTLFFYSIFVQSPQFHNVISSHDPNFIINNGKHLILNCLWTFLDHFV
ncbi:hypothetical protein CAEBREN_22463 [Caenorhabditis brenneri]|uniref:Uncharacterized protein n=1 Tax=Caenorhabditis brenneri TaxID=135651 RepID=G0NKS1_CAEBE|nr:hypothetical protein CAEBREN_22463 [Caenorhabditis brenneri]